jgi:hypothetical protein
MALLWAYGIWGACLFLALADLGLLWEAPWGNESVFKPQRYWPAKNISRFEWHPRARVEPNLFNFEPSKWFRCVY